MLKRKHVDDPQAASQLDKILQLGKASWASQRAIASLASSLRRSPPSVSYARAYLYA